MPFLKKIRRRLHSKQGLIFMEVMLALVILSMGLVTIIKIFLISFDRMNLLTQRLYATTILDNRMETIERMLRGFKALPFETQTIEAVPTGGKAINYDQKVQIHEVEDFPDIFQVDLSLTWTDQGKTRQLSRSAYVADFSSK